MWDTPEVFAPSWTFCNRRNEDCNLMNKSDIARNKIYNNFRLVLQEEGQVIRRRNAR
jgi:hypothetical protein